RFHVAAGREFFLRAQRPRAGFLHALLRLVVVFNQEISDAVKMIEVHHDLRLKPPALPATKFAQCHGAGIVLKRGGRVQFREFFKLNDERREKFPLAMAPRAVLMLLTMKYRKLGKTGLRVSAIGL